MSRLRSPFAPLSEETATPSGLCVATERGKAALRETPTGLLDFHASGGAFATPLDEDDDTPRSDELGGGAWSPEGSPDGSPAREVRRGAPARGRPNRNRSTACVECLTAAHDATPGALCRCNAPQLGELGEEDEFDMEPEALSYFQFGGGFGASGLPAALAAGTPAPRSGLSPPPPPAPRKGPTSFPTRVQASCALGSLAASSSELAACASMVARIRTHRPYTRALPHARCSLRR
jgi:hypothetical protein